MERWQIVITVLRNNGFLFNFTGAVAVGIIGATPERFAGVRAFLRHPFDHGPAALRTERSVLLGALLRTMFEPFGSKRLGKPTLFCERLQLLLNLLAQHHDEFVAQHKNTTSGCKRIVRIQPRVVLMLLIEDMYGT